MFLAVDEAGYTGADLLNNDQQYFVMASVNITNEEAHEILVDARKKFNIQSVELKAAKILSRKYGLDIINYIVDRMDSKFIYNISNKPYALCANFFEHIIEPIYQDISPFLYRLEFHRFISMLLYRGYTTKDELVCDMILQFQEIIRKNDVSCAPLLFNYCSDCSDNAFDSCKCICKITSTFKNNVVEYINNYDEKEILSRKWLLDLSLPSIICHLDFWAKIDNTFELLCDESKPLAQCDLFKSPEEVLENYISVTKELLDIQLHNWRLIKPVKFDDSIKNPSIQLADIVASTVMYFRNRSKIDFFPKGLSNRLLARGSIMPDFEYLNISNERVCLNSNILYTFTKMSEEGRKITDFKELIDVASKIIFEK